MAIFIIDNDIESRRSLGANATRLGHRVISLADAEDIWEKVDIQEPSIVVVDWNTLKSGDPGFCYRIREIFSERQVYILILKDSAEEISTEDGNVLGADEIIQRPASFDEVRCRIRSGERVIKLEQNLYLQKKELALVRKELDRMSSMLDKDLIMAGEMQRRLLPPRDFFIQGIVFQRMYLPSMYISGDLLNIFRLDENHISFYAIDVAGHGIAAAMMSFSLNQILSPDMNKGCPLKRPILVSPYYELILPPSKAVKELNERFLNENDDFLYFTMLYGVVNIKTKEVSLCQAGHPSPIYIKAGKPPQSLGGGGFPVGILAEAHYDSISFNYEVGDRLFLYSDGVTECQNRKGEIFGSRQLKKFIHESADLTTVDILKNLRARLCQWNGSEQFEDDVSIMTIEFCE